MKKECAPSKDSSKKEVAALLFLLTSFVLAFSSVLAEHLRSGELSDRQSPAIVSLQEGLEHLRTEASFPSRIDFELWRYQVNTHLQHLQPLAWSNEMAPFWATKITEIFATWGIPTFPPEDINFTTQEMLLFLGIACDGGPTNIHLDTTLQEGGVGVGVATHEVAHIQLAHCRNWDVFYETSSDFGDSLGSGRYIESQAQLFSLEALAQIAVLDEDETVRDYARAAFWRRVEHIQSHMALLYEQELDLRTLLATDSYDPDMTFSYFYGAVPGIFLLELQSNPALPFPVVLPLEGGATTKYKVVEIPFLYTSHLLGQG